MRRFSILKILGIAGCLAFLAGQAVADINITGYGNGQIQAPEFEDAPSGNMLKFNYSQTGDQSSLGTCTMNPMSSNVVDAIIEELPLEEPETFVAVQDYGYSPPTNDNPPKDPPKKDYPPPEDPPPNVPEPTTMLIMGMGIAGILPLRKYLRGK